MRRNDRAINGISDIEDILRSADVCRIGMANDNIPYIVTMNFGYVPDPEQKLYFHCAGEGKKLDMMRMNNFVCFEMDTDHVIIKGKKGCGWGMKFKSIIGSGYIHEVTDRVERITGLNSIMAHYGGVGTYEYDEKVLEETTILRLDIHEMTGKIKQ